MSSFILWFTAYVKACYEILLKGLPALSLKRNLKEKFLLTPTVVCKRYYLKLESIQKMRNISLRSVDIPEDSLLREDYSGVWPVS